ncbi:uncharacterized protein METZ01_LOCUS463259, partial [marine metagenome]
MKRASLIFLNTRTLKLLLTVPLTPLLIKQNQNLNWQTKLII